MSSDRPASAAGLAPSTAWALYAGGYAFLCGVALLIPLGVVAGTLVGVLGLSALGTLLVPASGAVVGAGAWWAIVERPGAHTYPRAVAVGVATALLAVLFWVLVVAAVWGHRVILAGGIVVAFVLAVALPVGAVAFVPLLYVRRRRAEERATPDERAPSR